MAWSRDSYPLPVCLNTFSVRYNQQESVSLFFGIFNLLRWRRSRKSLHFDIRLSSIVFRANVPLEKYHTEYCLACWPNMIAWASNNITIFIDLEKRCSFVLVCLLTIYFVLTLLLSTLPWSLIPKAMKPISSHANITILRVDIAFIESMHG